MQPRFLKDGNVVFNVNQIVSIIFSHSILTINFNDGLRVFAYPSFPPGMTMKNCQKGLSGLYDLICDFISDNPFENNTLDLQYEISEISESFNLKL